MVARLVGIQKSLANGPFTFLLDLLKELREEYWVLTQQEEDFWSVKSRYNWLIQGDRNNNFFHTSTLIRRKEIRYIVSRIARGTWFTMRRLLLQLLERVTSLYSLQVNSVLPSPFGMSQVGQIL